MSQPNCETIISASADVPLLHFRAKDFIVMEKLLVISEILAKINYVDLQEHLLNFFPSAHQVFMMPSVDSHDLPLSMMSFDQIEAVITKKQSNEVRSIIPGDSKADFESLKTSFASANAEEKLDVENQFRAFAHKHTLQAIASNALKKFATYFDTASNQQVLLLDNRKVFTIDKSRVKIAANRAGNTIARSLLLPISEKANEKTPAGKPRRTIEETQESGEDSSEDESKPTEPEYDSEIELVDANTKCSPTELIEISSGTSNSEDQIPVFPKFMNKQAKSKKHARDMTAKWNKPKAAKKLSKKTKKTVVIKKERDAHKIPKKSAKKADSSSSESSDHGSDSETSEQVK